MTLYKVRYKVVVILYLYIICKRHVFKPFTQWFFSFTKIVFFQWKKNDVITSRKKIQGRYKDGPLYY